MPWSQVTCTDGRVVSLVDAHMITAGETADFSLTFSEAATPGTTGFIEGTLGCGTDNPVTVSYTHLTLPTNREV